MWAPLASRSAVQNVRHLIHHDYLTRGGISHYTDIAPDDIRTMAACTSTAIIPRFLAPAVPRSSRVFRISSTLKRGISTDRRTETSPSERTTPARHASLKWPQSRLFSSIARSPSIRHDCIRQYPLLTKIRKHGFSSTASVARDHHFDTLKFVQRLREEGFNEEQAVAMMNVLSNVVEER